MRLGTREIALAALAVALTAAGAYLKVPVGPVPISLQTLFVLLAGLVLGARTGATAMVAYIVLGLAGLPLFTGGGGPGYLLSPTFGYLLSFPAAAYVAGRLDPQGGSTLRTMAALCVGTFVIYAVGVPWLGLNLRWIQGKQVGAGGLLMMGMVPFLPGDAAKVLFALLLSRPLRRTLQTPRD